MTKAEKRLFTTSVHEAGHVVAAYRVGLLPMLKDVTIQPKQEYLGLTRFKGLRFFSQGELRTRSLQLEAFAIVTLAGSISEKKYTGRYNHVGANKDYNDVAIICSAWFPNTHNQYMKFLQCQAENLFTINGLDTKWWELTLYIARHLMEEKTLTKPRVEEVIFSFTNLAIRNKKVG